MLEPHLIDSCQFSKCLSNKLLDMTSCSHHKIFVASLNSIDNPAEKKKKIERAKIDFLFAKCSGCCSAPVHCKGLFIEIIQRIIQASEFFTFFRAK